jgi:3-deoxy-D-manno-octulosonate 8-phosphate phosphatase (KDO 8-P phosphatase)
MQDLRHIARNIRLAIFDVDGVLTDGSIFLSAAGEELKAFHTLDGHGMKMLQASGIELAIISGRSSRCLELRARDLGIGLLYQGVADKLQAFEQLLQRTSIDAAQACYMGDDVVDLPVMRRCGLALAVPHAPALVRRHAHYVTRLPGGHGAVREACEVLLRARGCFDAQMASHLR